MPGLAGLWLKAGDTGLDASVFLDLPESGLYAVSVFGVSGGGMRFIADACRKAVLCAEPERTTGPQWRQVFSGQFAAGRHFMTVNLGAGAAIQRIRVERKKEALADYLATVRRLGLDLGADGPTSREKAVEAMRFIKARRGLEPSSLCQDVLRARAHARGGDGRRGSALCLRGRVRAGAGPGPQPPIDPIDPLSPPVLPPQEIASPVLPDALAHSSTTTT